MVSSGWSRNGRPRQPIRELHGRNGSHDSFHVERQQSSLPVLPYLSCRLGSQQRPAAFGRLPERRSDGHERQDRFDSRRSALALESASGVPHLGSFFIKFAPSCQSRLTGNSPENLKEAIANQISFKRRASSASQSSFGFISSMRHQIWKSSGLSHLQHEKQ